MAEKRLFKELKLLVKNHPLLTHSQIVELAPENEETSIFEWKAVIAKPTRDDSPYYYNGQWTLDIVADLSYPIKPPKVKFNKETPINHPNVDLKTGEICLDILKDESWSPAWNLEHIVLAILMLIDTPEPDSPFNVDLANLFRSDKDAFESVVQYTIWKHGTFYEGAKEKSGVKTWSILAYDISSEEEDNEEEEEEPEKEGGEQSKEGEADGEVEHEVGDESLGKSSEFRFQIAHSHEETEYANETKDETVNTTSTRESEPSQSLSASSTTSQSSKVPVRPPTSTTASQTRIIQNVGEEVKREFIQKATEVDAMSPNLTGSSSLHAAHESVTKAVSRQVEEICHSPPNSEVEPRHRNSETEKEKSVEEVKERFLRHIDEQVNQVRKFQECQRAVVQ